MGLGRIAMALRRLANALHPNLESHLYDRAGDILRSVRKEVPDVLLGRTVPGTVELERRSGPKVTYFLGLAEYPRGTYRLEVLGDDANDPKSVRDEIEYLHELKTVEDVDDALELLEEQVVKYLQTGMP